MQGFYPELAGHRFEIRHLEKIGEQWYAKFAIDGRDYPAFFEPEENVHHMREPEFLDYMRSQALTMMSYSNERMGSA